jgi:hypothetical protein
LQPLDLLLQLPLPLGLPVCLLLPVLSLRCDFDIPFGNYLRLTDLLPLQLFLPTPQHLRAVLGGLQLRVLVLGQLH